MGLTAKMTTGRGPILRPGQRLRRSVAAWPGPKNARAMVAPVRKRPKRVAKKIAARFGILHHRDVPDSRPDDTLSVRWIDQLTPQQLRVRMDVIRKDTRDLGLIVLDAEEEFSVEHRVEIPVDGGTAAADHQRILDAIGLRGPGATMDARGLPPSDD